jgi:hypothetical protein
MQKVSWLGMVLCICGGLYAQTADLTRKQKNRFTDSSVAALLKEEQVYELPVITLNETDRSESSALYVPSVLSANRDILASMASFHFSVMRFRMRGYAADLFGTQINGIPLQNPDDGSTQWSLWSGLNEVTRNSQQVLGLQASEYGFGNPGSLTVIDMRASRQRPGTQFGYAFSNRVFSHRYTFTHSRSLNRKGWSYAVSGSLRTASESYMPGTDYSSGSYYVAVDKQVESGHLLSLIFFGNHTQNSKQGPVLQESVALNGSAFYNPYWGYQSGRKRNANITTAHQPVLILTDEFRVNNHTTRVSSLGIITGAKSSTALDWFDAPDPRPDYYRYLPGYQTDTLLREAVTDAWQDEVAVRQINWDRLYEVNRNSRETILHADGMQGNHHTGLRAHYWLAEKVMDLKRIVFSTVVNTRINNAFSFTGGIHLLAQQTAYYTRIKDLLGAEYAVDWNMFAENDFPGNQKVLQNDLNRPNRLVGAGDRYGYDYSIHTTRGEGFLLLTAGKERYDGFAGLSLSTTAYYRDGKTRNGLFPFQSYGKSAMQSFTNPVLKAGITYKINGRKYIYLQGILMSKAPLFADVFISPRTRDSRQENVHSEKTASLEAGYRYQAPKLKFRLSGFVTQQWDGMNVLSFYHDGYRALVNDALWGINRIYSGMELGGEFSVSGKLTIQLGASLGRYYYNSRPQLSVTADNDAYELERAQVYMKNFRIEGTPQEAYGLGISYQPGSFVYMNLSVSYFREHWLSFNPLRRTYHVMENITEGSEQWYRMINQEKLPEQYTLDFSLGGSARLRWLDRKHPPTLLCHISINNLLNRKDMITGGYEQLRFDMDTKNADKFPPKYFYAMGMNFSVNLSIRL